MVKKLSTVIVILFFLLFSFAPSVSLAQGEALVDALSTVDSTAVAQCSVYPYNQVCQTKAFFGLYTVQGQCRGSGICVANSLTPLETIAITSGVGILTSVVNGFIGNTFRPNAPSSGGINISTGQSNCPAGRYRTSDINRISDPCAIYLPPTATPTSGCDLMGQLLGTCGGSATTTPTTDTTDASFTVVPNSGTAPLPVTFTVTDTSTSCPKSPITLSSGDGTASITAFPATNSCASRTPAVFTYTYGVAGTFQATVKNQTTQQTLQTVTVSVTGTTATTSNDTATLTVTPSSGAAPLPVTFTVTDTSTACPRAAIALLSGDGTASVIALPAITTCVVPRIPAVFTYTYGTAGTFQATIVNQNTQQTLQSVTVTVTGAAATTAVDTTTASLAVAPSSGTAPLAVVFTITDTSPVDPSPSCRRAGIVLSSGDGASPITALPAANTCAPRPPASFNYTYRTAGTFQASLMNQTTQRTIQTATIAVAVGSLQSTAPVNLNSTLLNMGGNVAVPANRNAGQPAVQPNYTQSSNTSDIQMNTNGATILSGGVRDSSKNTGSSAFFGADAQRGASAQGLAERMCIVRPWQNPLISSRISGSLFDSLCSKKGFPTGASADAVPATTPAATAKPSPSQPSASTTPAAPTAPEAPPEAAIWAVPSSVPLGSRASIFWNSKGATSCIVTSPDGSFSDSRLYGSASTVPLTGPTVYTISCLTKGGTRATNFVTVNIGS